MQAPVEPIAEESPAKKPPTEAHKPKERSQGRPEAPSEHKTGVKKVVTRASIIGEEQQRLRAEEERRKAELRARQEAEYLKKQRRAAELVRLKTEAEEKAVAARAAEAAKQVAAKTAVDKPAEDKTLHKPASKAGVAEKKSADKKAGQWKNEGANKRQGLKTDPLAPVHRRTLRRRRSGRYQPIVQAGFSRLRGMNTR